MKVTVLVIRENKEVLDCIGIEDGYTVVQLYVDLNKLSEESTSALKEQDKLQHNDYLGETEAMHFTGTWGKLEISIEDVEVQL